MDGIRKRDEEEPETLEEMWARNEEEETGAATPWKVGERRDHLLAPEPSRAPPGPSYAPPNKRRKRGGSRHKKSKRRRQSKRRKSKRRSKKKSKRRS